MKKKKLRFICIETILTENSRANTPYISLLLEYISILLMPLARSFILVLYLLPSERIYLLRVQNFPLILYTIFCTHTHLSHSCTAAYHRTHTDFTRNIYPVMIELKASNILRTKICGRILALAVTEIHAKWHGIPKGLVTSIVFLA